MNPLWGQLEKSAVDPEKIEEAIERIIAEHNGDPESHLGEGGSLLSHKASEIIDHVVASIIADKLAAGAVQIRAMDVIYVNSTPMQMEGCLRQITGSATITDPDDDIGIIVATGATQNSLANLLSQGMFMKDQTWNKERTWNCGLRLFTLTSQIIRFGMGQMVNDSPAARHIGFLLNNGELWATVGNGSVETKERLVDPTSAGPYYYKLKFFPGEKAEFYVDGVLRGTITENLPSGTIDPWNTFHVYIKNTAAEDKKIQIYGYEFWQNL